MRFVILLLVCLASPVVGDAARDRLIATTQAAFPRVPDVRVTDDIAQVCGGGVTAAGVYCTSENRIYLTEPGGAEALYHLAHLYGHGLQVRYGVADIALDAIRAAPAREAALRAMVTRQVECLAGFLIKRAGLDMPPLAAVFEAEPMTGAHWGRRPVRSGPKVSIGLDERADWFARGMAATTAAGCASGEISANLIAAGDNG